MKTFTLISFFVLFIVSYIFSQEDKDTVKTKIIDVSLTESKADEKLDSLNQNNFGLIGYPFAFYSPETELAFGAGGMFYFRLGLFRDIRLSKITISAYYTTNKQYNFSVIPVIYFPGNKQVNLNGKINFAKEEGKFFGVGNQTFDSDSGNYISNVFRLNAQLTGLVLSKLVSTGFVYEFVNNRVTDKMNNPYLNNPGLIGNENGKIGGLGLAALFDFRDNISYPESGTYGNFKFVLYRDLFGSDFTFNKFYIDLRQFWMPAKSHIFAFQYYSEFTDGDVPFFSLPTLGGSGIMRGFFEGRYRDKQFAALQVEYRKILFWRIGVDVFYSLGQVADKVGNFSLSELKHSYGFGLRYVFDKKEKINLRVDFGFANGTTGVYFNLDEAF